MVLQPAETRTDQRHRLRFTIMLPFKGQDKKRVRVLLVYWSNIS